jgi:TRAP-type C4-dicarboxylate transport system substrate-binding protein
VKGFDAFVKLMGAEPSFISTAELYEAMQRGTVDGCTISMSSLRSLSIQEVAPYFTIASLTEASQPAVMSLKARQRLPADIVKIIDEAYRDAEINHYVRLKDLVKKDTEFIKASAKVKEVYILPADEKAKWAAAAQTIYDNLAKKWGNEFTQFMTIRKTLFPS